MDKEEILSKLYSLRAGLSLIYGNIKKHNLICEQISNLDKELSAWIEKQYNNGRLLIEPKKKIVIDYSNELDIINKKILDYKKIKSHVFLNILIVLPPFIIWNISNLISKKFKTFLFILMIIAIICILVNISAIFKSIGIQFSKWKNISKLKKEIKKLEDYYFSETYYRKCVKEYYFRLIEQEKILSNIDILKQKINKLKNICDIILSESAKINKELENEFGSIIDKRDWEHVDYVIFCLETGRSDNIKESLFFTDNKNRHNEMKSTITALGEYLSNSIAENISKLGYGFASSINNLKGVITKHQDTINRQMDSYLSNISSNINESKSLLNQINTSNKEINISSKDMMYDIKKLIN